MSIRFQIIALLNFGNFAEGGVMPKVIEVSGVGLQYLQFEFIATPQRLRGSNSSTEYFVFHSPDSYINSSYLLKRRAIP